MLRAARAPERTLAGTARFLGAVLALAALALLAGCSDEGGGSSGGGGGSGGSSGAGGSSGGAGAPFTQGVGLPCLSNDDCPSNADRSLSCIAPGSDAEFGDGSPQGGYCSAPCEVTADCQALDELSSCVEIGGDQGAFCLATCQIGTPTPGAPLLKCGSDRPQVCAPASDRSDVGLCFPRCHDDARCGPGLYCDPGADGLCRTEPRAGGGVGAPCSPASADTDCQSGICLDFRGADGTLAGRACSASCTFASSNGCGYDDDGDGIRESACLQPQLEDGGAGDLGLCFELCDFASDCEQEGWVCRSLAGAEQVLGRVGECVPASLVQGSPDAGAMGGGG